MFLNERLRDGDSCQRGLTRVAADGFTFAFSLLPFACGAAKRAACAPLLHGDRPARSTMQADRSVLIVEDDPDIQVLLRRVVSSRCTNVDVAGDGQEAIARLRRTNYDIVVLDLMLPRANGFEVAEVIRHLQPQPRLIVLSAIGRYYSDRFWNGVTVLQKPFDMDVFESALFG